MAQLHVPLSFRTMGGAWTEILQPRTKSGAGSVIAAGGEINCMSGGS
jgi:hypothetical protein